MEMKNFSIEEYLTVTNRASSYLNYAACPCGVNNAKEALVALEDLFTPYTGVPDDERAWFDAHIVNPIRQYVQEDRSYYPEWRNQTDLGALVDRCLGYCTMLRQDLANRLKEGYRTARRLSR